MDGSRFDDLAGRVAARLNRRRGLGLLAGVSLPLLGVPEVTQAKKRKKLTLCNRGQTVTVPKAKAKKLLRRYQKAGLNAEIHIYKDARHELHNEKCRDEYFRDLVGFFDSAVKAAEPVKA